MKKRLDQLLVERDLADSRSKAQALVLAGKVLVGEQKIDKPGKLLPIHCGIRLKDVGSKYVGRGGVKLEEALKRFEISPREKVCMDVGASTGGFTDCLLQQGAKKVYAVDVGYGQFAWKLRKDPRVILLERKNIRTLAPQKILEGIDLCVVDVSFISLTLVFPTLKKFLKDDGAIIALIKPQFEVGPSKVGKKGVVKDPKLHQEVVKKIKEAGLKEGWSFKGVTPSPLLGAEGNKEFFIYFNLVPSPRSQVPSPWSILAPLFFKCYGGLKCL